MKQHFDEERMKIRIEKIGNRRAKRKKSFEILFCFGVLFLWRERENEVWRWRIQTFDETKRR